jgi:hypothetical protein
MKTKVGLAYVVNKSESPDLYRVLEIACNFNCTIKGMEELSYTLMEKTSIGVNFIVTAGYEGALTKRAVMTVKQAYLPEGFIDSIQDEESMLYTRAIGTNDVLVYIKNYVGEANLYDCHNWFKDIRTMQRRHFEFRDRNDKPCGFPSPKIGETAKGTAGADFESAKHAIQTFVGHATETHALKFLAGLDVNVYKPVNVKSENIILLGTAAWGQVILILPAYTVVKYMDIDPEMRAVLDEEGLKPDENGNIEVPVGQVKRIMKNYLNENEKEAA